MFASRRDADPERSGHQLQQSPAAGGIEAIEPGLAESRGTSVGALRRSACTTSSSLGGFGVTPDLTGPQERDCLGGIADIVPGEAETGSGSTRGFDQLTQDAAQRQAEKQSVRERR